MIKKLLLLLLITISSQTFSQSVTLQTGDEDYKDGSFGVLSTHNNKVHGYFNFYRGEKLKKGQQEYVIEILDENLNLNFKKKYINSKSLKLYSIKFNGQQLMVCFKDDDEKNFLLVGYDLDGNKKTEARSTIEKSDYGMLPALGAQGFSTKFIPIENKGFALLTYLKQKKLGYKIEFFPTGGQKKWTYKTAVDSKYIELPFSVIGVDAKGISLLQFNKKSKMSTKYDIYNIIVSTDNGKSIVKTKNNTEQNPKIFTNTFFGEKFIFNVGEYFSDGEDPLKKASDGLYFEKYDYTGKKIDSKNISWDNKVFGKFQVENDEKNKNHLYIHDIVLTEDGQYYAIAEEFKRNANATGIAMNALSSSKSSSGNTKLVITNSVIMNITPEFEIKSLNVFNKGKSTYACPTDFGSAQLNAYFAKRGGGFDYSYTQNDLSKNRFYSIFVDFERLKGEKNKFALKAIINNNGKYSEDKIYLQDGKTTTSVFKAKKGHVLLFDYNKKEKSAALHLEKLNIEF